MVENKKIVKNGFYSLLMFFGFYMVALSPVSWAAKVNENPDSEEHSVGIKIVKGIDKDGDASTRTKVTIKKSDNYRFIKLKPGEEPGNMYDKAVQIQVESGTSVEESQARAEKACRYYPEQLRKHYFVDVLLIGSAKRLVSVPCKDVEGEQIKDQQKPQTYRIEQVIKQGLQGDE